MNQMNSNKKNKLSIKERRGGEIYSITVSNSDQNLLLSVANSNQEAIVHVKQKTAETPSEIIVQTESKPLFLIGSEKNLESLNVIPTNHELILTGSLPDMSFDMLLGYRKVGKVRKRWVSSENMYELTIFEQDFEPDLIGLVSALDFITYHSEKARKNG